MLLRTARYSFVRLHSKFYYVLFLLVSLFVIASCGSTDSSSTVIGQPQPSPTWSGASSVVQGQYTADQASSHVGEKATVCGTVASTKHASSSNGRPTFLNFDKPYPNHKFTVVIWGSERSLFPASPESFYRNKSVCAIGLIEWYGTKTQIVALTESQLVVQ